MKLSELLFSIEQIAKNKGLSKPYIVGGLVRDKILNRINDINDVDLTTGDAGVHFLSEEVAKRLGPDGSFKKLPDGHSSITIGDLKLDFSSNLIAPGIDELLNRSGIKNPTEMQKELYSRDFTCNAALMDLNLKDVLDPTGLAIKDIKNKIIKTCLPVHITLGNDNKRIIRAIYLAAKLDFDIDPEIINWVKTYPKLISNSKEKYLISKMNKALFYNEEKTVKLFDEMNLWPYLPPTKEIVKYMGPQRM